MFNLPSPSYFNFVFCRYLFLWELDSVLLGDLTIKKLSVYILITRNEKVTTIESWKLPYFPKVLNTLS